MDIKKLLSDLTVEEKARMTAGETYWLTVACERLGIKSIWLSDGPHGLRMSVPDDWGKHHTEPATCFPTACALASSWDHDLIYKTGVAIAKEAKAKKVSVLLGPGINMKRSPLCGRNFEYFSEDPYLSGMLASSLVNGIQSQGVGACIKHFCLNNQETRRFSTSANCDERTMREIYLTAFELAVKYSKPATVMTSYNRVNGKHAYKSKDLITDILRGEFGFDGLVMSDWNSVDDRVEALKAGMDLEMPRELGVRTKEVVDAYNRGDLDMATLDASVERLLVLIDKYLPDDNAAPADFEANHLLAAEVEANCMVLLKNEDNILPLKKGAPLAVIGEFARNARFQGGGSSHINCQKVDVIFDEIKAANGEETEYAQGYSIAKSGDAAALREEAVALAKKCGRAVIFFGLTDAEETEGRDRTHMRLSAEQNALIEAVCKEVPNTALVLLAGSPVEMPWIGGAKALLHAYLGGEAVGKAASMVIFGDVNPSGHLAETLPLRLEDNPSFLNFPGEGDECNYGEGIYIGYRFYEKTKREVLFPFGHGLSYTTFELSDLKVTETGASCVVTNTGDVGGAAVVQLYTGSVKIAAPAIPKAIKELKGFNKVYLKAGESKTVSFELDERSFAYYEAKTHSWRMPSGTYKVFVGFSSADIRLEGELEHKATSIKPYPITRDTTTEDLVHDEMYQDVATELLDSLYMGTMHDKLFEAGGSIATNPNVKLSMPRVPRQYIEFVRGINNEIIDENIEKANKKIGL